MAEASSIACLAVLSVETIHNEFSASANQENHLQIMQKSRSEGATTIYDLDVVISVGYRVKSQRGVEFRRWATDVLHRYIIDGHVENSQRLEQLGQVARNLRDDYDHQRRRTPKGNDTTYVSDYGECRTVMSACRRGHDALAAPKGPAAPIRRP